MLRFAIVALRPTRAVAAENLFLRRQLAMYVEHGVKPRRLDVATVVSRYSVDGAYLLRGIPAFNTGGEIINKVFEN